MNIGTIKREAKVFFKESLGTCDSTDGGDVRSIYASAYSI